MQETKAILIINAIVNKDNLTDLKNYLDKMIPVFKDNGGETKKRFKAVEQLRGEKGPEVIAIIEFPNSEAIKSLIEGQEYKELQDLRERVFSKLNLTICTEV